jgi:hypothetical protein
MYGMILKHNIPLLDALVKVAINDAGKAAKAAFVGAKSVALLKSIKGVTKPAASTNDVSVVRFGMLTIVSYKSVTFNRVDTDGIADK